MIKLQIKLMIKKNKHIFVPYDKNDLIKTFLFRIDKKSLQSIISSEYIKEGLITNLYRDLYFLNFLINLGFTEDAHITSIYFEYDSKIYDYSYFDEEYIDNYWSNDPKLMLDGDYCRVSSYGYEYDEYLEDYGMDEENYDYKI